MVVVDYDYVKILRLAMLGIKLWLKEDGDLHTDHLQYLLKFVHSKAQDFCKTLSSLSHNFSCNIENLEIFTHSESEIIRVSFLKF